MKTLVSGSQSVSLPTTDPQPKLVTTNPKENELQVCIKMVKVYRNLCSLVTSRRLDRTFQLPIDITAPDWWKDTRSDRYVSVTSYTWLHKRGTCESKEVGNYSKCKKLFIIVQLCSKWTQTQTTDVSACPSSLICNTLSCKVDTNRTILQSRPSKVISYHLAGFIVVALDSYTYRIKLDKLPPVINYCCWTCGNTESSMFQNSLAKKQNLEKTKYKISLWVKYRVLPKLTPPRIVWQNRNCILGLILIIEI